MSTRTSGRHRAAVRPRTPLTELSEAVAASVGPVTRRTAVFAASSGLVVTFGLPAASAAPPARPAPQPASPAEQAQPLPEPAPRPTVSVPADAQVVFAGSPVTSVTPPPPPPPPPPAPEPAAAERSDRRAERASRSTERSSRTERSSEHSHASSERSSGTERSSEHSHASSGSSGGGILAIAARYAGTMYRYGGTTPAGFDCSGFTQYVYRQAGISIPRSSGAQAAAGRRIPRSEARPGDLVWTEGHIGIYAGGNMMWDSPRTGKAVQKRKIWYTPTFITYR